MADNVAIVREGYEHFAATGDALADTVSPDFVWDMSHFDGWPEEQTYDGVEGMRAFLRAWTEVWGNWDLELESLHESDEQVVAILRQRGQSKTTGLPLEMRFSVLWTLRDGKRTRMDMYSDPAEATRAAGLGE